MRETFCVLFGCLLGVILQLVVAFLLTLIVLRCAYGMMLPEPEVCRAYLVTVLAVMGLLVAGGAGAVFVTASDINWHSAYTFVEEQEQAHERRRTADGVGDGVADVSGQVVQDLLDCSELNLDELEQSTQQAIQRAQAFLASCQPPATADGVPVVPGMNGVFVPTGQPCGVVSVSQADGCEGFEALLRDGVGNERWAILPEEFTSTREAAAAAGGE